MAAKFVLQFVSIAMRLLGIVAINVSRRPTSDYPINIYVTHIVSLLLIEPYANESSQICPFLALRPQFESVHHQNRRLSSHSYSHESVIYFLFFGLIFVKLRRVCFF